MDLDTLGVIKKNLLLLSNYSLTNQLLLINFLTTVIGLLIIIGINFFLIQYDNSLLNKNEKTVKDLKNISFFLKTNSITRTPLFQNCRIDNLIDKNCKKNNSYDQLVFSEPELEPSSAQQFIMQNYFDPDLNIKIYNDSMIKIVDSKNLSSVNDSVLSVNEIQFSEIDQNKSNLIQLYQDYYNDKFNSFYSKLIKKKYSKEIIKQKHDINILMETTKKQKIINEKYIDKYKNVINYYSSPIISNNKVFGVIIISYILGDKNDDLAFTSFILFNFYILFILVMIFLSLFFVRDLITPLKQLTNITILERQKIRNFKNLNYPIREDEIGILAKQIQIMSKDLKLQMEQLEKFTTDVAHELKNPLTAIKLSSELLLKNNVSENNKLKVLKNFNKEVNRMNKLISDISNFSRTISEIETEEFKFINLNTFFNNFIKDYSGNKKNIKIETNIRNEAINVFVNEDKFIQVILNLIDNSVSLSSNNSQILITIDIINAEIVQIKFYDQGKGIKIEHKDKIFERFYTDRENQNDQHSGLGLSISKEIINSFSGTIELTKSDKNLFRGACFIIKLPLKH